MNKKIIATTLALFMLTVGLIMPVYPAYADDSISDYKDIPGITEEEIKEIEALKESGRSFSYAALMSKETFVDENGEISGFTKDFCLMLSDLFDIEFVPTLLEWDEIIDGLENKSIDFSGEFFPTKERNEKYAMSGSIAVRSIGVFYLTDGETLEEISKQRTPILGFISGSTHQEKMNEVYKGEFEAVNTDTLSGGIDILKAGEIDAFVCENVFEPYYEDDGEIAFDVYSPLVYNTTSLTTENDDLASIISVFDKYIASVGRENLSDLYQKGMNDYTRFVLRKGLSDEEKAYIDEHVKSGEKIPIILESGNYPISFYNEKLEDYQGIVPDLLAQVSMLTGMEFEVINKPEDAWASVLAMLESGEASIISELLHTPARDGQFLWPDEPSCVTNYALLSKSDVQNYEIYQMLGKKIGVEVDTAYHDLAIQWFPDIEILSFNSIDDCFTALDNGEVDFIMASENLLLSQTNYNESPGYKINYTIDFTAESKLGFNIEEKTLLSIFNKTHPYLEIDMITKNWLNQTFDYSAQLSETRARLFLISSLLLAAFIILLVVFLIKNHLHRRNLSSMVKSRTSELEEKTVALTTIYNAIPDIMFSKDVEGRYISCNPSFEKLTNLSESEICGKYPKEIFPDLDPDLIKFDEEEDMEIIRNGSSCVVEQLLVYPDGEKKLVETVKTALKQNDEVTGIIAISRDITSHREAEEAALQASKAKGSFLARMSHEIRTPLNAIVGMAEIAKTSLNDKEKTVSSVNQIIVSSHHLLGLINDVLDMSKIESGNLEILDSPYNLKEALEETITIITPRCNEKKINFVNNISEMPDIAVKGDKLRLNQVLINLLSNSAKFTDIKGTIEFNVTTLKETDEKIRLKFSVKDNGIGMSDEQISRLFKPFEQADNSIASKYGGTGLGLSISQNLVQQMGGLIVVSSEKGEGSEFSFEISFNKCDMPNSSKRTQAKQQNFKNSRVLLAEDIEINRMIVQELLGPTELEIEIAENGREAVEMFDKSEPGYYDLIFMDIQMPEMDGYEATKNIRKLSGDYAKSIPIIAMTANAYTEDVTQAIESGMNAHIGKPIDIDILLNLLTDYLSGK